MNSMVRRMLVEFDKAEEQDMSRAEFVLKVKRLLDPRTASRDLKAMTAMKQTQMIHGRNEKEKIDRVIT